MSSQTAVLSNGVMVASTAAQERWVEKTATQLIRLEPTDRELIVTQLRSAGARAGADWAGRFAARVSEFALWTGFVFASVIGAVLWAATIPSRHAPAAATAAAYLVIVVVALPVCWSQARRVLNYLSRISTKAAREFLRLYILALTAAAILYGIVNRTAFNAAADRHATPLLYVREFGAFCAVTALGFLLAYLIMAYAYSSALQESWTGQSLSWAGTLAATAVTGWLKVARGSPPLGNRCLDSGLLGLLGCTANIDQLGQGQTLADSRAVKSIIVALELAATDIEQYAVAGVPRFDTATRRLARHDGAQLASVIRDAKVQVARAIQPSNYTDVAITLAGFLLAWAHSGKNGFTTMVSSDTAIARNPLWRRALSRIWNAALLVAAGVVFPLLPIYSNDHAAAAGLRYALFTAAVLALATGGVSASGSIEENVDRTLPGAAGQASQR